MGAPIGNQNAVKENHRWADTLNRAIAQDGGAKLRAAAEMLLAKAAEGEPWAVKELGDRLDGKALQAIAGAEGGDLIVRLISSDAGA